MRSMSSLAHWRGKLIAAYLVTAFLFGLWVVAPAGAGMGISPGTPVHTHADANTGGGSLALSGTLSSTKACNSGFTRKYPNFCARTGAGVDPTWTDATACTQRNFGGVLPAAAYRVAVRIYWIAKSNNAIAQRTNQVQFFSDTSCVNADIGAFFTVREYAAVAAGTIIAEEGHYMELPLCATDTICATELNAGGNGNAEIFSYQLLGYYD